jgi:hypothetical protein
MDEEQKLLFAKGLINLANIMAGVFIVGLSVAEKNVALYVPVVGIAAMAGLYAISYGILTHTTQVVTLIKV